MKEGGVGGGDSLKNATPWARLLLLFATIGGKKKEEKNERERKRKGGVYIHWIVIIITSLPFSPKNLKFASSQTRVWPILRQTRRFARVQEENARVAFKRRDKSHDDLIRLDLRSIKCRMKGNLW